MVKSILSFSPIAHTTTKTVQHNSLVNKIKCLIIYTYLLGDILRTVSLRPTLLFGEEDRGFIPMLMKIADFFECSFPRISGPGGKHQLCYAGKSRNTAVTLFHVRIYDF